MKLGKLRLVLCIFFLSNIFTSFNCQETKDNIPPIQFYIGGGRNLYEYKYYYLTGHVNLSQKRASIFDRSFFGEAGILLRLNKIEMRLSTINTNLFKLNVGYDVGHLFKEKNKVKTVTLSPCYGILLGEYRKWNFTPKNSLYIGIDDVNFYGLTSLIGFKYIEFYYTFLHYSRKRSLHSLEFQYIFGINFTLYNYKKFK